MKTKDKIIRKRGKEYVDSLNEKLEAYGQKLQIISSSTDRIEISNGLLIVGVPECTVFRRSFYSDFFLNNFDIRHSTDEEDNQKYREIYKSHKSESGRKGAINRNALYGPPDVQKNIKEFENRTRKESYKKYYRG